MGYVISEKIRKKGGSILKIEVYERGSKLRIWGQALLKSFEASFLSIQSGGD
jgi:hypothetical protein